VKITPSNQTLILAGDRRGAAASSADSTAKSAAPNRSVLQRVTIVAARPDTTVLYLQADYSAAGDSGTARSALAAGSPGAQGASASTAVVAQQRTTSPSQALVGASRTSVSHPIGSGSGFSSYVPPAEQYARTQRILADSPRVPQIDVHA
jgi:hypothetical protein